MAALPHARVIGIFSPDPLPIDEHIEIVLCKHDSLDLELKRDRIKRFKVRLGLTLKLLQLIPWQQHGLKTRPILTLIGASEGFQRLIKAKQTLMFGRVLNRFSRAPRDGKRQQQEPPEE